MNEAQAAAYYDDVKAKGAAAHQQKRGLGYSGWVVALHRWSMQPALATTCYSHTDASFSNSHAVDQLHSDHGLRALTVPFSRCYQIDVQD